MKKTGWLVGLLAFLMLSSSALTGPISFNKSDSIVNTRRGEGPSQEVAEPATLVLLGGGLVGLWLLRRGKKQF